MVVSSDAGRADAYATEHGIGRGTTSVREAVGADVDAVYVSTTNDRHIEGVHAAVDAGRHVLCEKPLALTPGEAQGITTPPRRPAW